MISIQDMSAIMSLPPVFFLSYTARSPVRCMFEVRPTCRTLLDFALNRLNSETDKIILAKPWAIDHVGLETPAAQRMLSMFSDQVSARDYKTVRRPLKGEPVKALSKVCS